MMFSKACEYAMKAMIFVESYKEGDKKISLQEIADAIDSPVAFTAKILQQLRKNDLLISTAGAKGGFRIQNKKRISLFEIIEAIDGDSIFSSCALGLKNCSSFNPCPVHDKYKLIREEFKKEMMESFIDDLSVQLKNKSVSLK